MPSFFHNKKIIITGAASGIGRSLVEAFDAVNATLLAVDSSIEGLETLKVNFPKVEILHADLSQEKGNELIYSWISQNWQEVDYAIANAGKASYGLASNQNWKEMEGLFQLNVFSSIQLGMQLQKRYVNCRHVILASAMSYWSVPGYSSYAASKSALLQWADTVWSEGNRNLTLVFPIATNTAFFENARKQIPKAFPMQDSQTVARKILKGLKAGKKRIFPSPLFVVMRYLNRLLPFIKPIYQYMELQKLKKWESIQPNSE